LAIDNSLTLEFEDLPPLSIGRADIQVSSSSVVLNIQRDVGFYALRPFYIESQAGGNRFLSLMGSNVVINPQTGEVNQKFIFDPSTMTIKTQAQSNKSLNV
jgi:hypothetical protein